MKNRVRSYQLINYIIAGIVVIIIIYSGIFSPVKNTYPISCVHEQLTGMSCPSCGMSHSFSYMVRGNFKEAVLWNSYGPRVFLFFVFQLFLRISNVFYLKRHPHNIKALARMDISLSLLSFILGFWQFVVYNFHLIF